MPRNSKSPMYAWEIEIEQEKVQKKIEFINIHSKKLGIGDRFISFHEKIDIKKEFGLETSDLNEIIDKGNDEFIDKQRVLFLKEFRSLLSSRKELITDSDRLKLKSKYQKEYYNFYDILDMDKLIDDFNFDLKEKQKRKLLDVYRDELGHNGYITNSERKILKSKLENKNVDIVELIKDYNESYIKEQEKLHEKFFENIQGKSLDKYQIHAILTDDDATQIVAGAGTGKTTVLQGKIKYLLQFQNIKPEEILCTSFSNAAVDDLETKIRKTIGDYNIKVKTVHSIGKEILNINDEANTFFRPTLKEIIDKYFKEVVLKDPKLVKRIIEFFSYDFNISFEDNSLGLRFRTMKDKVYSNRDIWDKLDYEKMKERYGDEKLTFKREYVKSVEELIIANFLFINNIDYEYEKQYVFENKNADLHLSMFANYLFDDCNFEVPDFIKFNLANEIGLNFYEYEEFEYNPDFYLPDYDIYIEHFGVDRDCNAKQYDKEKSEIYKQQMFDKIKLHEKNGTKLITTFSYYNKENRLLSRLEEKLKDYGVIFNEIDYNRLYDQLILSGRLKDYTNLMNLIERFINLFKGNALHINSNGKDISKLRFKQFKKDNENNISSSNKQRNAFLLNLIEKIYQYYQERKGKQIDFNDMIINAILALKKGATLPKYKYILVDEYQDTSYMRYELLKIMQEVTGAKLVVVGDDWQSIYGFAGSEIHLFSNFEEFFENPAIVKIQNTYRNSQELIKISGNFIMENESLIKKQLSTKISHDNPVKIIHYRDDIEEILYFLDVLSEISKKNEDASVLILGRNNDDISEVLCHNLITFQPFDDYKKITCIDFPKLDIKFRTIHKSKGLEADYVIILNLKNRIAGFPNQISNDPILEFVTRRKEKDKLPEERRLFYVALTRTRNDVYLFSPLLNYSDFIKELEEGDYQIERISNHYTDEDYEKINLRLENRYTAMETKFTCPHCKLGNIKLVIDNHMGYKYFRCTDNCGWYGPYYGGTIENFQYVEPCSCGGMLVVKQEDEYSIFLGCTNYDKYSLRSCRNHKNIFKI